MTTLDPLSVPVVILSGGRGSRLNEETERVPKPLLPIGDKPILWHIMKIYSHHGFGRFVLPLGYKGWDIRDFFLRYREHVSDFTLPMSGDHRPEFHDEDEVEGWTVTCADTGLTTGTGARLRRVARHLDADTFMVTYGDGVASVDVAALLDFHRGHGLTGTVTAAHPASRWGEMRLDGDRVAEFSEKPDRAPGLVSGGFFVFERRFLDDLDDDPGLALEQAPLQGLAARGELAAFTHDGFWMGMDTHREYLELNRLWDSGEAPWKVW